MNSNIEHKPYSEVIAPFLRTTNSPLELDFIFDSEENLDSWSSENRNIIHEGLCKVVCNNEEVTYWTFIKNGESFTKKRVISTKDIDDLKTKINDSLISDEEFKNNVNESLDNLNKRIQVIWGVPDESVLNENLNSIKKIIDAITCISNLKIKDTDKALAGTTEDDVITYLRSVKYNSITALSSVINAFLNEKDNADNSITTWLELKEFLSGFKDTDVLKDYIEKSLGGSLNFVNSDTVLMSKSNIDGKQIVKSELKLDDSDDNQIIIRRNGVYINVSIKINDNLIEFYVNDNLKTVIDMNKLTPKFKDVYYEPATESLVIVVTTMSGDSIVRVPMSVALREWTISNDNESPVVLSLIPSVGDGKDLLSAQLKISTEPDNIIEIKNGHLFVNGIAENIKYKDNTVYHALEILSEKIKGNEDSISKLSESIDKLQSSILEMSEKIEQLENKHKWINA